MSRTSRVLLVGAALLVAVVAIGTAVGFGSAAWIAAIVAVVVALAGIDRNAVS